MNRLLAVLVALSVGSPIAVVVFAPGEVRAEPTAARMTAEERFKFEWQQRYRLAIARERTARVEYEQANLSWKRGMRRHRLRGDRRVRARERLQDAEAQFQAAMTDLESIPEDARRAGVPPGWLREVEG